MFRFARRLSVGLFVCTSSSIILTYKYKYFNIYGKLFDDNYDIWMDEKNCFKAFCYSFITQPNMFLLYSPEAQYTIIDHIDEMLKNIKNDDVLIEKLFDFNVVHNTVEVLERSKLRNCRHEVVNVLDTIASKHEQYCKRILKIIGWNLLLSSCVKYARIDSPLFDSEIIIAALLDDPIIPVNVMAQKQAELFDYSTTYDLLVPLLNKLNYDINSFEANQHLEETQRILDKWSDSDESLDTSSDDLAQIIHLLTKKSMKDPDEEPPDFHYHSLRALASSCARETNAGLVIDENGLYLLNAFCDRYRNDERIKTQAARAIANLARSKKHLTEIIRNDFLKHLIVWSRNNKNIKLHLQAIRALSNMRHVGDPVKSSAWYHDELYILYSSNDPLHDEFCIDPIHYTSWYNIFFEYINNIFAMNYNNNIENNHLDQKTPLDIIFVHGLLGSPLNTWRTQKLSQTDIPVFYKFPGQILWPKYWLPMDISCSDNIRILTLGYHSLLSSWSGQSTPLDQRSLRTLIKLKKADIGVHENHHIIFVAHSMGGLLVKHMLKDACENNTKFIHFKNNTKAICFYGTPHFGSPLTGLSKYIGVLFRPSLEVNDLKVNTPLLIDLNDKFLEFKDIRTLSFGENEPIPYSHMVGEISTSLQDILPIGGSTLLVPPSSANPKRGVFIPIDKNHFDLCKPRSKSDIVYSELVALINKSNV